MIMPDSNNKLIPEQVQESEAIAKDVHLHDVDVPIHGVDESDRHKMMQGEQYLEIMRQLQEMADVEKQCHGPTTDEEKISKLTILSNLGQQAERLKATMIKPVAPEEKGNQRGIEVRGLTGIPVHLKATQESCPERPGDLFGFKLPPLPRVDPVEDVEKLLEKCQATVRQLKETMETTRLSELVEDVETMMIGLRKHNALLKADLTPSEGSEKLNSEINHLCADIIELLTFLGPKERELIDKLIKSAWCWEDGPPPAVKSDKKCHGTLTDMSIRLYGCAAIVKSEIFVCQESDKGLQKVKLMRTGIPLKTTPQDDGMVVCASEISLQGLQESKRKESPPNPNMYRLVCHLDVDLGKQLPPVTVECRSTPFLIHTGSPQLWPYTARVVWYLWTQPDVRTLDCKSPREISLDSLLGLIQARINGAGLSQENGDGHYRRLNDGERCGWKQTLREKYGLSTSGMLTRDLFCKMYQKPKPSTLWTHICAAVNSGLRLKKNGLDRFFQIGLTRELCQSSRMKYGEFLVRSSMTTVNSGRGKEPYTTPIFEASNGKEVFYYPEKIEIIEKLSLRETARRYNFETEGNKIALFLLPGGYDVNLMGDESMANENENNDGYHDDGYMSVEKKAMPQEFLIRFREMSLSQREETSMLKKDEAAEVSPTTECSASPAKSLKLSPVTDESYIEPPSSIDENHDVDGFGAEEGEHITTHPNSGTEDMATTSSDFSPVYGQDFNNILHEFFNPMDTMSAGTDEPNSIEGDSDKVLVASSCASEQAQRDLEDALEVIFNDVSMRDNTSGDQYSLGSNQGDKFMHWCLNDTDDLGHSVDPPFSWPEDNDGNQNMENL